ncbi:MULTISPECIES: metal ABC transporter substrate-binding protein [Ruminococcus]|jgi:zinc transport system substrate-binding protein|uniref:metal ABC transporter substrate-binding protein n=1 Tax=Ruminococcus sp. TaxID=41978 RepID=UPI0015A44D3D|nr:MULTISPECIES: metal ABC transporter substrate-binding protein [Ruminococcus]
MKKLVSIFLSTVIICSLFSISGCGKTEKVQNSDGKISIVTTIFPYYDFVRQLAGDKADVRLLLSPGSDPHSYEPTPSDIVAIENCDIFIYNGGESDEWVDGVLSSIENKNVKVMKMMEYVTLRHEQSMDHNHEHAEHEDMDDNDEGHDHEEGEEYDEHIWTSIRNAERMSASIADELISVDSKNSDYYNEKKADYISSLDSLDKKFTEVANNKKRDTLVFGDRFPFLYFVSDYDLGYECAFPGCSHETEPSTAVVSHLIDFTRENNIPVVFYLELSSGKIAQIISEDSSAKTMQFSSCHNVTKEDFENGATYISVMEQNLEALKEALY